MSRTKIPGPKVLREWGSRGARALGERALRLPALQRGDIVGRRTLLRHPTPLKTTPSMSKAAVKISALERAGISILAHQEIEWVNLMGNAA